MSYAMTHLIIANEFAKKMKIEEKEIFLLAGIAPDAVHVRADFTKPIKGKVHCLPEGLNWGEVYEEKHMINWYEKVKEFYEAKICKVTTSKEIAFLQGFTLHLLIDVLNCNLFYAANWIKFGLEDVEGYRAKYREECILQDNYLYCSYADREQVVTDLEKAMEEKYTDILKKLGLDQYLEEKDLLKNVEYQVNNFAKAKVDSLEGLSIVTEENTQWFLDKVLEECLRMLFDFPKAGRTFEVKEV